MVCLYCQLGMFPLGVIVKNVIEDNKMSAVQCNMNIFQKREMKVFCVIYSYKLRIKTIYGQELQKTTTEQTYTQYNNNTGRL